MLSMNRKPLQVHMFLGLLFIALSTAPANAAELRFDCGTGDSPVMDGYRRLTADEAYNESRGYGWQGGRAADLEFRRPVRDLKLRGSFGQSLLEEAYDNHRNPINRDGVISRQDMGFRLDVPNGVYRVAVTMGSLSTAVMRWTPRLPEATA